MSKSTATAADVRTWAVAEGHPAGGSRGRLPKETIAAFNEANEAQYAPASRDERKVTVEVVKRDKSGRKRKSKRTMTVPEARAVLGVEGKKGRISLKALSEALSEA